MHKVASFLALLLYAFDKFDCCDQGTAAFRKRDVRNNLKNIFGLFLVHQNTSKKYFTSVFSHSPVNTLGQGDLRK